MAKVVAGVAPLQSEEEFGARFGAIQLHSTQLSPFATSFFSSHFLTPEIWITPRKFERFVCQFGPGLQEENKTTKLEGVMPSQPKSAFVEEAPQKVLGSTRVSVSADTGAEANDEEDEEDPHSVVRGGWSLHRTSEGRVYYYNEETTESSWDVPKSWVGFAPDPYDDPDNQAFKDEDNEWLSAAYDGDEDKIAKMIADGQDVNEKGKVWSFWYLDCPI